MKTRQIVLLREWDECLLDIELTAADRVLIRQFSKAGTSGIRIEELRGSVRVQTTSSIGVICLDSIEIRIEPKLAGNNLRVVEMLEIVTGLDLLRRYKENHDLKADDKNLFDLLVLLLVTETERLIRAGLLSSYVVEEDILPVIRGRFLGDRQMLLRFGMLDKVHCRFDDLSQNIPENQVLASALASSEALVSNGALRYRIRNCLADLLSCCDPIDVDFQQVKQQLFYDRLNLHYRQAHELSWLILEQTGLRDFQNRGRTSCFSFLLNMNQLFEQFITRLICTLLGPHGFRVTSQQRDGSIIRNTITGRSYATVIPDIRVFPPSGSSFCIDAKYKLYDESKVSNSDIYQTFLYAFAFGQSAEDRLAFLIYPSTQTDGQLHCLDIKCADHSTARLMALGLHIPTVLDEIRRKQSGPASEWLRDLLITKTRLLRE